MRAYPSFPIVIPLLKEDSYALLTRPPLKFLLLKISVRLACVKHTTSVHPEPGSNSQKKQIIQKLKKLFLGSLNLITILTETSIKDQYCPPLTNFDSFLPVLACSAVHLGRAGSGREARPNNIPWRFAPRTCPSFPGLGEAPSAGMSGDDILAVRFDEAERGTSKARRKQPKIQSYFFGEA